MYVTYALYVHFFHCLLLILQVGVVGSEKVIGEEIFLKLFVTKICMYHKHPFNQYPNSMVYIIAFSSQSVLDTSLLPDMKTIFF